VTYQAATTNAAAIQRQPKNIVVYASLARPGESGPVEQKNAVVVVASGANEAETTQAASQPTVSQSALPRARRGSAHAREQTAGVRQAAITNAAAGQTQPMNLVISVRINSPGDTGPITQTNRVAVVGSAANESDTMQTGAQADTAHARLAAPEPTKTAALPLTEKTTPEVGGTAGSSQQGHGRAVEQHRARARGRPWRARDRRPRWRRGQAAPAGTSALEVTDHARGDDAEVSPPAAPAPSSASTRAQAQEVPQGGDRVSQDGGPVSDTNARARDDHRFSSPPAARQRDEPGRTAKRRAPARPGSRTSGGRAPGGYAPHTYAPASADVLPSRDSRISSSVSAWPVVANRSHARAANDDARGPIRPPTLMVLLAALALSAVSAWLALRWPPLLRGREGSG
jgi:hypothetical protein